MEALHSEMIKHMLEAADAKGFSALFNQPLNWTHFEEWCHESQDANQVITRASEKIETVCIDAATRVYCVAMSIETLEQIVRALVEAYEDRELERFLRAA